MSLKELRKVRQGQMGKGGLLVDVWTRFNSLKKSSRGLTIKTAGKVFTSKVPRLSLQMSTLHLLLNFLSGLMPRVIKVRFNGVVWLRKMAMIAREKFYTPTQE